MGEASRKRSPRQRSEAEILELLIAVLDAYMDVYPGGMKIRGIKTALLIQQASLAGTPISVSELARLTGAPPESVRRHIAKHVALGNLDALENPEDARSADVVPGDPDAMRESAALIAKRLSRIDFALLAGLDQELDAP
jgi:hypothetical protein